METLRGLVMSYCPNINKVSASVILQRHWDSPLPIVELWGLQNCPDEQMNRFEDAGLFPIDIGLNYYKTTGHRSAPESVAKELDFFKNLTAGELKLIELVEEENASRGSLKKWPMSFTWFIRFAYHLPRFKGKEAQIGLIELFRSAVNSFVDGYDAKTYRNETRDPRQFAEAFPQEASLVEKCQFAPLTIGRYLRDLWVTGCDEDYILEKAALWLSIHTDVEHEMESARHSLVQDPSPRFRTRNGLEGIVLETPSFFLTYAASGRGGADIVVAKNPETGHGIIKIQRKNLTALVRKMNQLEPGRWHEDLRTGHLVNGGPMYPDTVSTSQPANNLAKLVEEFPPQ